MATRKLYEILANKVQAMANCEKTDNWEWHEKHQESAESLVKKHLPNGSGYDSGTTSDFDKSTGECLVFNTAFHHMDENGFYDGWTNHVIRVRASLVFGLRITISGLNRNGIKDIIHTDFECSLTREIEEA